MFRQEDWAMSKVVEVVIRVWSALNKPITLFGQKKTKDGENHWQVTGIFMLIVLIFVVLILSFGLELKLPSISKILAAR
jgi:hypothetical protein